MDLVELAHGYHQASSDTERERWSNLTSKFVLTNPTTVGMVRKMLHKKRKSLDREDDAVQDVAILFVMKYLPAMDNPDAAWGMLKGALEVVESRMTNNYYDLERTSSVSIDAAREDEEVAKDLLSAQIAHQSKATAGAIIDKMMAKAAKNRIHEAIVASKMNGKNALSWLPQITTTKDERRPLPRLDDLPPVVIKRKPTEKVPETREYARLLEIRDLSGMSIEPFAEALRIGVPRLRSYLNRKSYVHPEVLQQAEHWYAKHGRERRARLKKLKAYPLPELIEKWKKKTKASTYAELARIIDISVPTMVRWRKGTGNPMHDSHLLQAEDLVLRHCRSMLSYSGRES